MSSSYCALSISPLARRRLAMATASSWPAAPECGVALPTVPWPPPEARTAQMTSSTIPTRMRAPTRASSRRRTNCRRPHCCSRRRTHDRIHPSSGAQLLQVRDHVGDLGVGHGPAGHRSLQGLAVGLDAISNRTGDVAVRPRRNRRSVVRAGCRKGRVPNVRDVNGAEHHADLASATIFAMTVDAGHVPHHPEAGNAASRYRSRYRPCGRGACVVDLLTCRRERARSGGTAEQTEHDNHAGYTDTQRYKSQDHESSILHVTVCTHSQRRRRAPRHEQPRSEETRRNQNQRPNQCILGVNEWLISEKCGSRTSRTRLCDEASVSTRFPAQTQYERMETRLQ